MWMMVLDGRESKKSKLLKSLLLKHFLTIQKVDSCVFHYALFYKIGKKNTCLTMFLFPLHPSPPFLSEILN